MNTSIPDIPRTPSQGDEFGIDKYEKGLKMFLEDTGTPIVEINVVDNSNLEKVMYEEKRKKKNA